MHLQIAQTIYLITHIASTVILNIYLLCTEHLVESSRSSRILSDSYVYSGYFHLGTALTLNTVRSKCSIFNSSLDTCDVLRMINIVRKTREIESLFNFDYFNYSNINNLLYVH